MAAHKKIQPTKVCRVDGVVFCKPTHKSFKAWEQMTCCSKVCAGMRMNHKGTYDLLAKKCKNALCGISFIKPKKDTHEHFARQQYCSISCSKMGKLAGESNNNWKGDEVGYSGVHLWMRKTYGKPQFCEKCKRSDDRMYHWANISKKYKRERSDWYRLCVPHHREFDNGKWKTI